MSDNALWRRNMAANILRLPTVKTRTGLSRSTIYLLMSQNKFPAQISLSERTIGWLESDIDQWLEQRVAMSRLGK